VIAWVGLSAVVGERFSSHGFAEGGPSISSVYIRSRAELSDIRQKNFRKIVFTSAASA
jgi:hypothetical protein